MYKERYQTLIVFLVFALLCSFPLFYNLGEIGAQMWDESRNAINAIEMLYDHQFIVTHYEGQPDMWNTKPPFFIWMAALCMKLFGTTVFSLRLPSALSAFVIVIYSFWISKKYLQDWRPGFFAGLILVTSVGFIDYHVARNGDFDALLSMWIFLYSTQYFIYLETHKKRNLILSSLFIALAILTKGIAGCLFLPGLFILTLISKKYRICFTKAELYIFPLCGILLGASYYFIRELYNHGFIEAVLTNEITGRYMEVNEGHREDAWFYLRFLYESHFSIWLYWIPISIFIVLHLEGHIKKLGIFLCIQLFFYLLIISLSQTKLKWYDAPLFPFMALLIGLGITYIYEGIKNTFLLKKQFLKIILFIFFLAGVFSIPVQSMWQTSIFAGKELNYTGLFYGDFMENFFYLFPRQKSLKIISYGYNPHLLFYAKVHRYQGRVIDIIPQNAEIQKTDTVMICDNTMWPNFNPSYVFDTIYQEGNHKFILTLNKSTDSTTPGAVFEKKLLNLYGTMQHNKEWLISLKEKANSRNIDIKKQALRDAMWMLSNANPLPPDVEEYLKRKYKL